MTDDWRPPPFPGDRLGDYGSQHYDSAQRIAKRLMLIPAEQITHRDAWHPGVSQSVKDAMDFYVRLWTRGMPRKQSARYLFLPEYTSSGAPFPTVDCLNHPVRAVAIVETGEPGGREDWAPLCEECQMRENARRLGLCPGCREQLPAGLDECDACHNDLNEKEKTMGTTVRDTGSGDFEPAPADTHIARCVQLIDLGTQPGSTLYPAARPKIRLGWELPNALMQTDRGEVPWVVGQDYTASLSEKAKLRQHLESWRGREFTEEELAGFALTKVLGQPCLVTVVHKTSQQGRKYAVVSAVTKVPQGMPIPAQVYPSLHYEIEMGMSGTYGDVPEWVQEKIKQAAEWHTTTAATDANDDIPF